MCIKIVGTHGESEFEPSELLEYQVKGAKQIVIDYSPDDDRIQSFMDQMDRIIKNGVGCQMNIRVNSNNSFVGHQFKKKMEEASKDLNLNEVIKTMVSNHSEIDRRLGELSQICLEKVNER